MAGELRPLKVGDKVFIKALQSHGKPWHPDGKVSHVVPGNEPEKEKAVKVQIESTFLRTDLELYDSEAEREKRESILQAKVTRVEEARKKLTNAVAQGSEVKAAAVVEFLEAFAELNAAD
jgi:hypothetical protein